MAAADVDPASPLGLLLTIVDARDAESVARARQLLASHRNDVQAALEAWFNPADEPMGPAPASASASASTSAPAPSPASTPAPAYTPSVFAGPATSGGPSASLSAPLAEPAWDQPPAPAPAPAPALSLAPAPASASASAFAPALVQGQAAQAGTEANGCAGRADAADHYHHHHQQRQQQQAPYPAHAPAQEQSRPPLLLPPPPPAEKRGPAPDTVDLSGPDDPPPYARENGGADDDAALAQALAASLADVQATTQPALSGQAQSTDPSLGQTAGWRDARAPLSSGAAQNEEGGGHPPPASSSEQKSAPSLPPPLPSRPRPPARPEVSSAQWREPGHPPCLVASHAFFQPPVALLQALYSVSSIRSVVLSMHLPLPPAHYAHPMDELAIDVQDLWRGRPPIWSVRKRSGTEDQGPAAQALSTLPASNASTSQVASASVPRTDAYGEVEETAGHEGLQAGKEQWGEGAGKELGYGTADAVDTSNHPAPAFTENDTSHPSWGECVRDQVASALPIAEIVLLRHIQVLFAYMASTQRAWIQVPDSLAGLSEEDTANPWSRRWDPTGKSVWGLYSRLARAMEAYVHVEQAVRSQQSTSDLSHSSTASSLTNELQGKRDGATWVLDQSTNLFSLSTCPAPQAGNAASQIKPDATVTAVGVTGVSYPPLVEEASDTARTVNQWAYDHPISYALYLFLQRTARRLVTPPHILTLFSVGNGVGPMGTGGGGATACLPPASDLAILDTFPDDPEHTAQEEDLLTSEERHVASAASLPVLDALPANFVSEPDLVLGRLRELPPLPSAEDASTQSAKKIDQRIAELKSQVGILRKWKTSDPLVLLDQSIAYLEHVASAPGSGAAAVAAAVTGQPRGITATATETAHAETVHPTLQQLKLARAGFVASVHKRQKELASARKALTEQALRDAEGIVQHQGSEPLYHLAALVVPRGTGLFPPSAAACVYLPPGACKLEPDQQDSNQASSGAGRWAYIRPALDPIQGSQDHAGVTLLSDQEMRSIFGSGGSEPSPVLALYAMNPPPTNVFKGRRQDDQQDEQAGKQQDEQGKTEKQQPLLVRTVQQATIQDNVVVFTELAAQYASSPSKQTAHHGVGQDSAQQSAPAPDSHEAAAATQAAAAAVAAAQMFASQQTPDQASRLPAHHSGVTTHPPLPLEQGGQIQQQQKEQPQQLQQLQQHQQALQPHLPSVRESSGNVPGGGGNPTGSHQEPNRSTVSSVTGSLRDVEMGDA